MEPLEISSDALTAHLSPRRVALLGLYFAKDTNLKGNTRNLVLGFADLDQHHIVPIYAGALVGPVTNRISGGQIPLDSVIHQMPRNEANRTTLHSGPKGLHAAS
jgi:aldose 1-epimerase